ncbi:hypothetical protein MIND_00277500 [Mycena indigotica]|uniref:Uncharacterized protein n=1 Tax=Mycena indigotica TaxID=2126181 RepID=A0A8H6T8B7_9AGAR|nr:uncharacterized protein MIND_00277500 [Mycena indigotica]KAF7312634.1 hypothetical protein MIND_00277500 [Mycena indigotica]
MSHQLQTAMDDAVNVCLYQQAVTTELPPSFRRRDSKSCFAPSPAPTGNHDIIHGAALTFRPALGPLSATTQVPLSSGASMVEARALSAYAARHESAIVGAALGSGVAAIAVSVSPIEPSSDFDSPATGQWVVWADAGHVQSQFAYNLAVETGVGVLMRPAEAAPPELWLTTGTVLATNFPPPIPSTQPPSTPSNEEILLCPSDTQSPPMPPYAPYRPGYCAPLPEPSPGPHEDDTQPKNSPVTKTTRVRIGNGAATASLVIQRGQRTELFMRTLTVPLTATLGLTCGRYELAGGFVTVASNGLPHIVMMQHDQYSVSRGYPPAAPFVLRPHPSTTLAVTSEVIPRPAADVNGDINITVTIAPRWLLRDRSQSPIGRYNMLVVEATEDVWGGAGPGDWAADATTETRLDLPTCSDGAASGPGPGPTAASLAALQSRLQPALPTWYTVATQGLWSRWSWNKSVIRVGERYQMHGRKGWMEVIVGAVVCFPAEGGRVVFNKLQLERGMRFREY